MKLAFALLPVVSAFSVLSGVEHSKTVEPCAPPAPVLPTCAEAEPQAPRDLTAGATGNKPALAAVLNLAQASKMPQTNVHFHLGAEHKAEEYSDDSATKEWEAGNKEGKRPGFMCKMDGLTEEQLKPYDFKYCKGVEVGKSFEVHYVHSSAGGASLDDGLGAAAGAGRNIFNPMVAVQAQVFHIVNEDNAEEMKMDLVHGWDNFEHDALMYSGSTTGTSVDNDTCSPYTVTWHVDKICHKISAAAFDNMCKQMKDEYNMEADLKAHGSRILVHEDYVVPADEVMPLA